MGYQCFARHITNIDHDNNEIMDHDRFYKHEEQTRSSVFIPRYGNLNFGMVGVRYFSTANTRKSFKIRNPRVTKRIADQMLERIFLPEYQMSLKTVHKI